MNEECSAKIGDIVLVWGKGFVAKLIGFLIRTIFGVKNPATHVQMVYDEVDDISAEAGGVTLVNRARTINEAKKVIIIRHKDMTDGMRDVLIKSVWGSYLGKSYDYFLYVLWTMRIAFVLNPLVFWLLYPFRDWLKKREKFAYTCSELVSAILADVDIPTGVKEQEHRNFSPHHFNMLARGAAEVWPIIAIFKRK